MQWTRIARGAYVDSYSAGYKILYQPTTFGIGRATNDMWFVYLKGAVLTRRRTLAEAKHYAERHAHARRM